MNEHQIAWVKGTWQVLAPNATAVADLFYERLFALEPALRGMFPDDMAEQKRKLMATLALVVSALDDLPAILPQVEALGRAHVRFGVEAAHYQIVGTALLATLEIGLAEAWTSDVKASWITAWTTLSGAMIAAANAQRGEGVGHSA